MGSVRYRKPIVLGAALLILLVAGLGWWLLMKHQQQAAQQRIDQVIVHAKHNHHGRVIIEHHAGGRLVYLLPQKMHKIAPAVRQRVTAALPQSGSQPMVLAKVTTTTSGVAAVAQQQLRMTTYRVQGRQMQRHQLPQQPLGLVQAQTGKAATVGDLVPDDGSRRAINYLAKQIMVKKHRQTAVSLEKILAQPLLASLQAKNFSLAKRQLQINDTKGKPLVSVPLAKLKGYLKGQRVPVEAGKVIALTFDDGPNDKTTPQILKTLAAAKVKATFFMVGTGLREYPQTARAVAQAGHEIGIHTYDHPYLPKLTPTAAKDEIYGKMALTYYQVLGQLPTLLRPPFGAISAPIAQVEDLPAIQWSIDSQDWRSRNAAAIIARVNATATNGGIVLMHDIQPATVQALPTVISQLKAQGYRFVTVSELFGGHLLPGQQYFGRGDERAVTTAS
ncbi:polysaccharide deacetylase family protein [Lacticaseibacillus baoqingensis]|uniref:Polysaccharide deacetylase family protein n=1 Tax=Lacticaseibacillus baoqingensis TaxID=2486013 RepID=A0ABW4E2I4_9LACO|nr:polysaccharide deacetylase family protein [Lacticaseibacillus baoqingensis]